MGWRGLPAVVKVASQLAGGSAMPGTGAVESVHSVGKCGRRGGRARMKASWVTGMVWQRKGSGQEGPGRLWVVFGLVGSTLVRLVGGWPVKILCGGRARTKG